MGGAGSHAATKMVKLGASRCERALHAAPLLPRSRQGTFIDGTRRLHSCVATCPPWPPSLIVVDRRRPPVARSVAEAPRVSCLARTGPHLQRRLHVVLHCLQLPHPAAQLSQQRVVIHGEGRRRRDALGLLNQLSHKVSEVAAAGGRRLQTGAAARRVGSGAARGGLACVAQTGARFSGQEAGEGGRLPANWLIPLF